MFFIFFRYPRANEQSDDGESVRQILSIVDLSGLGLGHLRSLCYKFLSTVSKIDQGTAKMREKKYVKKTFLDNYPESLGHLFIVNPPWTFKAAWKIIHPWLHENTRQKIQFLGSNYKEEILKVVDAENLPEMYKKVFFETFYFYFFQVRWNL